MVLALTILLGLAALAAQLIYRFGFRKGHAAGVTAAAELAYPGEQANAES
ncbi:hypothetical protein BF49_3580 [Bradyrhizobium sp.]|nr:hypothetical protein [Bradyrhizobium sp.]CUT12500.1 hypothetical protein BF49_3580 [Bradyrhizobium sp.]